MNALASASLSFLVGPVCHVIKFWDTKHVDTSPYLMLQNEPIFSCIFVDCIASGGITVDMIHLQIRVIALWIHLFFLLLGIVSVPPVLVE